MRLSSELIQFLPPLVSADFRAGPCAQGGLPRFVWLGGGDADSEADVIVTAVMACYTNKMPKRGGVGRLCITEIRVVFHLIIFLSEFLKPWCIRQ